MASFFAQYPEFDYDQNEPIAKEFYRMCDYFGWEKGDDERDEAHAEFKTAMVLKFNELYGTDTEDIECWHRLCVAVDIDPLPATIKDCKAVSTARYRSLLVKNAYKIAGNAESPCELGRSCGYFG
jgi:hypothetical protein